MRTLGAARLLAALPLAVAVAGMLTSATGCAGVLEEDSRAADENASTEDALIGGKAAGPRFPSTVYLESGCTAAKVAPRVLLTAAHCIFDPATADVRLRAADALRLSRDPTRGYESVAVADARVHPAWQRACEETYCGASEVTARVDAPDVAVIVLARDLGSVSITPLDDAPLRAGDDVELVGYGCTRGVHVADARRAPTLAWAKAKVSTAGDIYALTPGPGAERGRTGPGLCPGDSGGPLYRVRDGQRRVVGVNANYTLAPEERDAVGRPIANWHTRVDRASRHDVAGWLAAVMPR